MILLKDRFFNITTLEEDASNQQHKDKRFKILLLLLRRIKEFITVENIELVYTKGLLKNSNTSNGIEVIIFTKNDKIVVAKTLEELKRFEINIEDKNDINGIVVRGSMAEYKADIKHEAIIKFKNGNMLELNCLEDSNEHWEDRYSEAIAEIIRIII